MKPEVHNQPLQVSLLGTSLTHNSGRNYGEEIIQLLDQVWPVVRAGGVANKGINWVVYDEGDQIYAGIETNSPEATAPGLYRKEIQLARYASWEHIGPYHKLHEACSSLNKALKDMGLQTRRPLIEVYGHWNEDESKLETTILVPLQ